MGSKRGLLDELETLLQEESEVPARAVRAPTASAKPILPTPQVSSVESREGLAAKLAVVVGLTGELEKLSLMTAQRMASLHLALIEVQESLGRPASVVLPQKPVAGVTAPAVNPRYDPAVLARLREQAGLRRAAEDPEVRIEDDPQEDALAAMDPPMAPLMGSGFGGGSTGTRGARSPSRDEIPDVDFDIGGDD